MNAADDSPSTGPRPLAAAVSKRAAVVREALPLESRYVVRILVTAAVAWQACVWLGATNPPVYAVVVPLVALRDAPYSAFNVSLSRLVGVVAGLGIGIGVLAVLRPGVLSVTVVLGVALLAAIVLRAGGALNVQVAASALLVFANPTPSSYAVTRLWETAIGAVATVVLAPLLLPTNPARVFRAEREGIAGALATILREAARLAGHDARSAQEALTRLSAVARESEEHARTLGSSLAAARRAVRYNPLWRWRRAGQLPEPVAVEPVTADVAASTRLFVDELTEMAGRPDARTWWSTSGLLTAQVAGPLADVVEARLGGRSDDDAEDRARAALLRHIDADGSRFGTVIRRPLRRVLLLLCAAN